MTICISVCQFEDVGLSSNARVIHIVNFCNEHFNDFIKNITIFLLSSFNIQLVYIMGFSYLICYAGRVLMYNSRVVIKKHIFTLPVHVVHASRVWRGPSCSFAFNNFMWIAVVILLLCVFFMSVRFLNMICS